MDDWEKEDYEPEVPVVAVAGDKWDGEDADDGVKDNWEDSEDENKPESEQGSKEGGAYQRPKKKPLAERIAEKNRQKVEAAAASKAAKKEMSAEDKLAEKIRLQKVQEAADLKNAEELFGVGDSASKGAIDKMLPETKEEFDQLAEALKTKITFFESSKEYGDFVEKLINDLSVTLPVEVIKKIGVTLNTLYHEKERMRKEAAKSKKKKQKAVVRIERDDLGLADGSGADYFDDGEDFI